jgi:hypothetical protein
MSSETGNYLDGNAAAGAMSEIFAHDMTSAEGQCAFCGTQTRFADARLYTDAPGLVARCVVCDHVLARIVRAETQVFLEMQGLRYLRIDLPR